MFRISFLLLVALAGCHARTFTFRNNLGFTVWVGSLGNPGHDAIDGGGWRLDSGQSVAYYVPDNWAGRFWGRTGCSFDGAGNGACATGDCGRGLKCNGAGGAPPATLAEFTLQGWGGLDYYDISNVDGFNVPLRILPTDQSGSGYSCTESSCPNNINNVCPNELRLYSGSTVVGCKSACLAFNTDQYCCRNDYGTPDTCKSSTWPVNYPAIFKSQCPLAYSYAYDDVSSTFTCSNTNYQITFG